jgi:hypothetical protein
LWNRRVNRAARKAPDLSPFKAAASQVSNDRYEALA